MAYDENGLRETQGTIGELLYANFLDYQFGIRFTDPQLQKLGVDWCRSDLVEHTVDVKLSPHIKDYFAVTYRNQYNIRMPFKKGCEAVWLGIVTFDWEALKKDRAKGTEPEDELDLSHKVREILRKEYKNRKYAQTVKLISKYCLSIVDVKVLTVRDLCAGFAEKGSGESNTDNNGNITATRVGIDVYAAAHIKWSAIPETSRVVHWSNPSMDRHHAVLPPALTKEWPFQKNGAIEIDEQGKTLLEMRPESVRWILNQSSNSSRSTFYKTFGFSHKEKPDFHKLLTILVEGKDPPDLNL